MVLAGVVHCNGFLFCFQAEDGIRDLVRSRGLGDVYKRQGPCARQHLMQQILGRGLALGAGDADHGDLGMVVDLSLIHI